MPRFDSLSAQQDSGQESASWAHFQSRNTQSGPARLEAVYCELSMRNWRSTSSPSNGGVRKLVWDFVQADWGEKLWWANDVEVCPEFLKHAR